jgi:hypothetical protein
VALDVVPAVVAGPAKNDVCDEADTNGTIRHRL